jgi:hypothetical protein
MSFYQSFFFVLAPSGPNTDATGSNLSIPIFRVESSSEVSFSVASWILEILIHFSRAALRSLRHFFNRETAKSA